ncbi:isopenicillin N synthase family oxygenase [Marinomonas sp. 15G1-11]|uniref:2-oxoglutarate-dependent ethylene/succinate-forming enzyme n=1 Tax=Marinomonas phaeophyticola TaxID=3004091 RepID=A0ABT4JY63_9GAMM|nr:2-oxoglutarate and iron-dependent oxygenase domain-containing protein [Marinomonas sp. 15G1-11]MCZ2723002.1 isopenicillin N synthase family oxygenase [Marinomonas sp. 15G1-11]
MTTVIENNLHSITPLFEEIPVIDLSSLLDGSNEYAVAKNIGDVCENVGFMYIKNHGVPQSLIDRMYQLSQMFFALSLEQKSELDIALSGKTLRGYIKTYAENVNPTVTNDLKECLDLAKDSNGKQPFFGTNPYPKMLPEFKEVYEAYYDHMMVLGRNLVKAIALSLDLPADYFEALQKDPITIQRFLHYPPQTGMISEKEIGVGEHTDYGFLTILSQDSIGGLQVRNRAGEWISAPPIDGTFIVNIGDLVQTFTNDKYISTMHRVINAGDKDRYSMPFFMDLDFDAVVDVVPTCQSDDHPSKYSPYTCGEHKFSRFIDSFPHLSNQR